MNGRQTVAHIHVTTHTHVSIFLLPVRTFHHIPETLLLTLTFRWLQVRVVIGSDVFIIEKVQKQQRKKDL